MPGSSYREGCVYQALQSYGTHRMSGRTSRPGLALGPHSAFHLLWSPVNAMSGSVIPAMFPAQGQSHVLPKTPGNAPVRAAQQHHTQARRLPFAPKHLPRCTWTSRRVCSWASGLKMEMESFTLEGSHAEPGLGKVAF